MLSNLNMEPSGNFFNFCRMSAIDFEYFIVQIGPRIAKMDTNMRKCIPVQERLAVALRFLATGDSYASLAYLFKFSPQTVSKCVDEVCAALIDTLKGEIKVSTKFFKNLLFVKIFGGQIFGIKCLKFNRRLRLCMRRRLESWR